MKGDDAWTLIYAGRAAKGLQVAAWGVGVLVLGFLVMMRNTKTHEAKGLGAACFGQPADASASSGSSRRVASATIKPERAALLAEKLKQRRQAAAEKAQN